ncbi:MAG: hypothetical protein ACPGU7_02440 [Gammaproteobacteria bacterium]
MSKKSIKPVVAAVGALFAASVTTTAMADTNPFGMQALDSGYMQVAGSHEGKCGSGKCGGEKKSEEAKCGAGKCGGEKKSEEAKCGAGKCGGEKTSEGKCGAGKCGGEKKSEGKCGSGKCGGSK